MKREEKGEEERRPYRLHFKATLSTGYQRVNTHVISISINIFYRCDSILHDKQRVGLISTPMCTSVHADYASCCSAR